LIGQTVPVQIDEATAFTLFGEVLTDENVGVEEGHCCEDGCETVPLAPARRFGLPLV
jgi:hypothetical protein